MPIILAIEPDRRQAAHVSAIVRHRVGAELILADTTEGALDAIGGRVPDLVLVPALLSPQDDAALAAALRVIAAAAHVRTLTIPVFANGTAHAQRGGLLARFRRGRAEPTAVGCDPAVFAEQILEYLREAAVERADIESNSKPLAEPLAEPIAEPIAAAIAPADAPAAAAGPEPQAIDRTEPPPAFVETPAAMVHEEPASIVHEEPVSVEAAAAPLEFLETTGELFAGDRTGREPLEDEASDDEVVVDLSDEITEISAETEISPETSSEALFDGEPFGVYTLSFDEPLDAQVAEVVRLAETEEVATTDPLDEAGLIAEFTLGAEEPTVAPRAVHGEQAEALETTGSVETEAAVGLPEFTREDTSWLSLGLRYTRQWPVLEGVLVESGTSLTEFAMAVKKIAEVDDAAALAAPVVAPPPAPRSDHMEWSELVASLRQDIERRRNQPASAAAAAVAARPTEAQTRLHTAEAAQSRRLKTSKPIQDEWGFFDPEQCGFAALLAKLDEFSEGPDEPAARPPS